MDLPVLVLEADEAVEEVDATDDAELEATLLLPPPPCDAFNVVNSSRNSTGMWGQMAK